MLDVVIVSPSCETGLVAPVVLHFEARYLQEPLFVSTKDCNFKIHNSIRSLLLKASIAPLFMPGLWRTRG